MEGMNWSGFYFGVAVYTWIVIALGGGVFAAGVIVGMAIK